VASLFSGCGVLDYGLTQAGHEIILQTESEDSAREVLAARFQGICQPRDAGMVETLPADTDVLAASVVSAELEGSWRESWSKDSVASKLKQVLRLMKSSPRTPWVLIEASTALLENPDGDGVPIICDLVSEFERLGYRWAHRTVAPAAFGVPDVKPRVVLVGSKHGDPRDVLLTEDAGQIAPFDAPGPDQAQAFVFNRQADGRVRVFSDFVEGFHPAGASCVLMPGGGLTALEVHDAERLQGLPPGWTLTSRPPAPGTPVDNTARWNALAASTGCVPATQWIGSRLANPYKHKVSAECGVPFDSPITVPWPPAAYNVGAGRCAAAVSPFPRATPGTALPTLGAFISPPIGAPSGEVVTKETALDCVKALRAAGWQPPPQLIAVEVAAEAAIAAAAAATAASGGMMHTGPKAGEKRGSPALHQDPVAAQAAALAALAPMMAAVQAADAGAMAGLGNPAAALAAAAAAEAAAHQSSIGGPRSKKSRTAHKEEPAEETADESEEDDPDDDSYTVANITLRARKESQVVWAKLPGHPFWPGLKVDLKKDKVPPETLNMRKENEALVIFFGENSFGWVREDQVLDFKEAYAEKAREPIRNKARFNSALQEALNDIEKRGVAFVPPAIQQRGKGGGHHHGHANGHGKDAKKDANIKKDEESAADGQKAPVPLPQGEAAIAKAAELAAAAARAVASGRLTTEGCACRVCSNPGSPKNVAGTKGAAPICLRIEAQKSAADHPVGAMLTLQGEASVGHVIEIFWPLDDVHYGAKITSYDPVEMQHMVMYDADGVREYLCLWTEDVKVLDGPTPGEGPAPDAPRDHATQPGMAQPTPHASAHVNGGGSTRATGANGGDEAGDGAKPEPMETADGDGDGALEALMGLASDSSAPPSPAPSSAAAGGGRAGGQRAAANGATGPGVGAGSGSSRLTARQATREAGANPQSSA